jgi:NAD+--dinitrogen-reductase ADP-D-ribosyltransferase
LDQQLDLLYTFCQGELARRHPGKRWLTLHRGTHDPGEYAVRSQPLDAPRGDFRLVEFNNLSSFTSDPEVAWEFGSSVWQVRVPLPKILCFSGLLPPEFLQGESEFLVLGGVYRVASLKA